MIWILKTGCNIFFGTGIWNAIEHRWTFALNISHKSGLIYGAIIGGIIALIFTLIQKYSETKEKKSLKN